jgi:surface antigen
VLAGLCAIGLGLSVGGCSISYKLDSMFGDKEDTKPATTGSVPATPAQPAQAGANAVPQERDLAYAKAAVSEVLSRGGTDASQPWENPQTGARGTVTPVATAYTQEGFTCRDFRASYVRDGNEAWLQGEACRMHRGKWEVRSMRPLQRS